MSARATMKEIRFHGRGGQGAVTATNILSLAAYYDGKYAQSFPFFGVERRGAPVEAFLRISDEPIEIRTRIYEPDCIVVLDTVLRIVVNVAKGLKEGGSAILNSIHDPDRIDLGKRVMVATVDATRIAMDLFGKTAIPITNTAMLGAFTATTRLIKINSIVKAMGETFRGATAEKNQRAAQIAYEKTKISTRRNDP